MKNNYNTELDFILESLIKEYENINEGVKFYAGDAPKTTNDTITQLIIQQFDLKEWEVNVLYHHLLLDKFIISIEPLHISLEGIVFKANGGYTQKILNDTENRVRLKSIENDVKQNSHGLMIFTAVVALGTLISAWYFAIEIFKYYFSNK